MPVATPDTPALRIRLDDADLLDISGIVARSHNMPLRNTFSYLNMRLKSRVEFRDVHPIFLMALLRIADYLELESERAPKQLLQVRRLRSPISIGEWVAHNVVRDIRRDDEDPEAVFVDANPTDIRTFLKLKRLLLGLQHELDISWAVLGEVYGNQQHRRLDNLGMILRRVKSNLDDVQGFANSAAFVPVPAQFDADPELLKLLIKPLYGDRPEVGVRELMQNAVDAVLERNITALSGDNSDSTKARKAMEVLIAVKSRQCNSAEADFVPSDWEYWIEVFDQGRGMTADTVRRYFLCAGASFRQSDAWRRQFTKDDGNSTVLRSGRFGIGVLAAFLLGDRLKVRTRFVDDNRGLEFEAQIDDSTIEMRYLANCAIGTTVAVKLSRSTFESLTSTEKRQQLWDWFCLENPSVLRTVNNVRLKQAYQLPSADNPDYIGWRSFKHSKYRRIDWTFTQHAPNLTCNGILIRHASKKEHFLDIGDETESKLLLPKLSVFDANGNLPINLQRTDLIYDIFDQDVELRDEIIRDLVAYIIATAPDESEWPGKDYPGWSGHRASGLFGNCRPWLCGKSTVAYAHPAFIDPAIKRIFFAVKAEVYRLNSIYPPADTSTALIHSEKCDFSFLEDIIHRHAMTSNGLFGIRIGGVRCCIPRTNLKLLKGREAPKDAEQMRIRAEGEWQIYEQGELPPVESDVATILSQKLSRDQKTYARAIIAIYPKKLKGGSLTTLIRAALLDLGITSSIPYQFDIRCKKLGKVFRKLKLNITAWRRQFRK